MEREAKEAQENNKKPPPYKYIKVLPFSYDLYKTPMVLENLDMSMDNFCSHFNVMNLVSLFKEILKALFFIIR